MVCGTNPILIKKRPLRASINEQSNKPHKLVAQAALHTRTSYAPISAARHETAFKMQQVNHPNYVHRPSPIKGAVHLMFSEEEESSSCLMEKKTMQSKRA